MATTLCFSSSMSYVKTAIVHTMQEHEHRRLTMLFRSMKENQITSHFNTDTIYPVFHVVLLLSTKKSTIIDVVASVTTPHLE